MATEVPATPPVAPPAPPAGPAAAPAVVPPAPLEIGKVVEQGIMGFIYDSMGGDPVIEEYFTDHREDIEKAANLFGIDKQQIETRGKLQELHITQKIMLLIYAQFKGGGKKKDSETATTPEAANTPAADSTLADQLKEKGNTLNFAAFQAYWKAKGGEAAPLFPDAAPHSIWRGEEMFNWVKIETALASKDKDVLKKWPELFPYPAGSRVVMDKTQEEIQNIADAPGAKLALEPMGLKLVVVPAGTVAPTPAADEIQLVSVQDTEPMDWEKVKAAAVLWDDTVPTQFAGAPKTLAAIQVLKDSKSGAPQEPKKMCEKVGLTAPEPAFLEWLKTVLVKPLTVAEAQSVETAKAYFTTVTLKPEDFDFDKAVTTKPGEARFDKSYTFMTDPTRASEHPNNASLKKETVAWFLAIPSKAGADGELVAFDSAGKIVGLAD